MKRRARAKDAPEPETAKPELTGMQEQIADVVGDLLINGGPELRSIVWVSLKGYWRRMVSHCYDDPADIKRESEDYANKWLQRALDELAAARQLRKRLPVAERPTPTTASERIREAIRERAADHFIRFLAAADPEEVAFLNEVLGMWETSAINSTEPAKELAIAEAFEWTLNSDRTYLRVPDRLASHVAAYANALANATAPPEPDARNLA